MITKEQAIDILERFDLFQGQRAGRELWNDKPFDVQEQDIAAFSRDVALLKDYINAAEVAPSDEVEYLKEHLEMWCEKHKKAREEIEQLRHKYELAVAEREANVKGFTEAIGRIKTVVAAEIFAEIDSITKEFISGDIDGYTLVVRLFMLKNKHAEEKA